MVRQLSARAQVIVAAAATCGVAVLAAALTLMPSPAAAKARSKRPKRKRKKNDKNDSLSSRGSRLTRPALPYMGGVLEGFAEPYDAATGKGVILLAVAENKLCWPRLKPRVEAALAQVPDWTANYGPMDGCGQLKAALARFLDRRIIRDDRPRVLGDHVSCAAGAAACLINARAICEAGDSVLIPAPYYARVRHRASIVDKRIPVRSAATSRLDVGQSICSRANQSIASPSESHAVDAATFRVHLVQRVLISTPGCGRRARQRPCPFEPAQPDGPLLDGRSELRLAVGWCESGTLCLMKFAFIITESGRVRLAWTDDQGRLLG